VAQLALAYQLIPDGVLLRAADRPDYLYDPLKQAASKPGDGEKIVLVVDALDEAGTPLHQSVMGLPSSLPARIYIKASQRPQHVDLHIDTPLTPQLSVPTAAESDDNRDDMRRFLANAAAWPGVSQALQQSVYTSAQFVVTLLEKCRGVWIYLRYVVHDIERGERSSLALSMEELRWRSNAAWRPFLAITLRDGQT
jgi:hypothetical protein